MSNLETKGNNFFNENTEQLETEEKEASKKITEEEQYEWTRKIVRLRQEYYKAIEQLFSFVEPSVIAELKDNLINIYQAQHKKPRKLKIDNSNDLIKFFTNYEINYFFIDIVKNLSVAQKENQLAFTTAKQEVLAKSQIYVDTINVFLEHFQNLCCKIAYNHTSMLWQKELRKDAAHEGWIALRRAVDTYNPDKETDPTKQASFLSYGIKAVKNEIQRFVASDNTIGPPEYFIAWQHTVNSARDDYKNLHNGQEPSVAELSAITGFVSQRIRNILSWQKNIFSLNALRKKERSVDGEVASASYESVTIDPKTESIFNKIDEQLDKNLLFQLIEDILRNTPIWSKETKTAEINRNRAIQVFNLYFKERQTFADIASEIGTSKQTITDIFKRIFLALRQSHQIDEKIINALEKTVKNKNFNR